MRRQRVLSLIAVGVGATLVGIGLWFWMFRGYSFTLDNIKFPETLVLIGSIVGLLIVALGIMAFRFFADERHGLRRRDAGRIIVANTLTILADAALTFADFAGIAGAVLAVILLAAGATYKGSPMAVVIVGIGSFLVHVVAQWGRRREKRKRGRPARETSVSMDLE